MSSEETGLYIIARQGGATKIGMSHNVRKRLSQLQHAQPEKLELVFFGVFGARSAEIESEAKRLLKPWKIRGEWFKVSPFIAGIAFEAARDGCERRRAFLAFSATYRRDGLVAAAEWIKLDEQAEREFPELYARLSLRPNVTEGLLGGRKIHLPSTQYTRLIVEGFPEVEWGAATKPPQLAMLEKIRAEREARYAKRKARAAQVTA